MKKLTVAAGSLAIGVVLLVSACTTVNLTSWKDPASTAQINEVVVLGLFDKLEVAKTMEENVTAYFTSHGLKAVKSLDFMAPGQQLSNEELKQKIESLNADAVLVFVPRSADKSVNYTPPTYSGYYRGWYGGAYSVSPGYYSESTTYHIQANLYTVKDEKLVWTGDLSTTDPSSIDAAASYIGQRIYDDWVRNNLVATSKSK
jgi:hypothetical protein